MITNEQHRKLRIVFVSMVPEAGHVIPLLRIASAIKSEQVSCYVIVPEEARKLPVEHGFEYELLPSVLPANADSLQSQISRTSPLARKLFFNGYFESRFFLPIQYHALSSVPILEEKLKRLSPDLIVADEHLLGTAVHYVGQRLNIPVLLHLAPGSNQLCQTVQPYAEPQSKLLTQLIGVSARVINKLFISVNKLVNRAEQQKINGKKDFVNREWRRLLGELNLASTPKKLFTTGLAVLESLHLRQKIQVCKDVEAFGPLPPLKAGKLPAEIEAWINSGSGKPLILVSLGSWVSITAKIANNLVEGIKQTGCRILWISRNNPIPENYRDDPDILWASWAPQTTLLANERVKCFVSHAGSGAVQEAFWFAKPMLCIPQIRDQPYNAWVVESLGAGRTISKAQISKVRVSNYLNQVLHDNKIREKISSYSEEVRKLDSEQAIRAYLFSRMVKEDCVDQ